MLAAECREDAVILDVVEPDLIRRTRHHLLGRKRPVLDEPSDAVVRDAEYGSGSEMVTQSLVLPAERYASMP